MNTYTTILLLAIFALFQSCNKTDSDLTINRYSDEELFKGIFLVEGEVSNLIGSHDVIHKEINHIFAGDPELYAEFKQQNNDMYRKIKELDPSFFSQLRSAIESRQADQLQGALNRGNKLIGAVVLPKAYAEQDFDEAVALIESVDIDLYDIGSASGLESYLHDVENNLSSLERIDLQSKKPSNRTELGKCLTIWGVVALVVWDAIAVVNYGLLVNAAAGINVYVAANVLTATNVEYQYGSGLTSASQNYAKEVYYTEIFELAQ